MGKIKREKIKNSLKKNKKSSSTLSDFYYFTV